MLDIVEPLSDEYVLGGQSVVLMCKLREDCVEKHVEWLCNGRNVGPNCAIATLSKECSLKIDNVRLKDEGSYTCKITVGDQYYSSSAKLTVVRNPDAPEKPLVKQITSTSVSLSWNVPFDGHSPVTLFIVECKDMITNM